MTRMQTRPKRKGKKKKRSDGPRTCRQKCSDCGGVQTIQRCELNRAARLHCPLCGGPLNWFREA